MMGGAIGSAGHRHLIVQGWSEVGAGVAVLIHRPEEW